MSLIAGTAAILVLVTLFSIRSLKPRPYSSHSAFRLPLALLVLGVYVLATSGSFTPLAWAVFVIGLLVGAGIGALRGMSYTLYRAEGRIMRRGTWITIGLWLLAIVLRVGVDWAVGATAAAAASVGILTYLAVAVFAQRGVLLARTRGALAA